MDLTRQPPRRPSNARLGGIAALARMADKARAANAETLGEFKYGDGSGLDREVLEFIRMSADDFAREAGARDDASLAAIVAQAAGRSAAEIEAFNREHLEREPQDDQHRRLLVERLARYAPGRTDVRTVFSSIELDDWGAFRDLDLSLRPPRSPYLRAVAGVAGAARMGDKARATRAGTAGDYRYGPDSGIDEKILDFLGIDADDFADAAYANANDIELGEWVRDHTRVTPAQICAFNARITGHGRYGEARERFVRRRATICPDCGAVQTWFDLIDYDDEHSFDLVDLARHAPRSPYDVSVGGVTGLARMIDKGRAHNGGTLGEYWYGDDSGADRAVLELLGVTAAEFAAALRECATDEAVVGWLGGRLEMESAKLEKFNRRLQTYGPTNDEGRDILRRQVERLDATRTDIDSWYALMQLDDQVTFARLRAGV